MPYLKIQTNTSISNDESKNLAQKASALVAEQLGKPEQYVMVALQPGSTMLFAGSDEPLAYLELKSIGLPESKTKQLSEALCNLVTQELGISSERTYIEFADAPRSMWGWNGGTF
jgi:phenylpyruvate tautomerase PptA (4-oxalocrotonate tautomerase family)